MTSTFKAGTAGHGGFCGCSGLHGALPAIFVLYLNNLLSEALSSTSWTSSL